MRKALVAALALLASAACSPGAGTAKAPAGAPRGAIIVASFDFAESELLSELYATVLQYHGYPVRRAFNLGPREVIEPALQQGRVDIVPEYLGSALSFVTLGKADVDARRAYLFRQLTHAFKKKGVDPLALAPAQDENGIVVSEATAARYNLRKVSDLKPVASKLVFGGPAECESRPFCLPGLERTYGLHFKKFEALDAGGPVTVSSLQSGLVDVGLLFTTDPNIVSNGFVLLRDDRGLQPPDNVVPVVSRKVLKEHGGGVVRLIDEVTRKLSTDTLRRLNVKVQVNGRSASRVALQWLKGRGII
ncbi:MAG: osmoprotectant transport system substrate-binding protein [Actinomycetota bacterium]|jgi:osmoprotectant transport system substrate-binding protein|nr:osmoprotectant transport system substrate-binding protein [Actinomycetota bacterium]